MERRVTNGSGREIVCFSFIHLAASYVTQTDLLVWRHGLVFDPEAVEGLAQFSPVGVAEGELTQGRTAVKDGVGHLT